MEQYDDVSVGEIDLFFKMLVKGEFGPVYNSLDPATIISKFQQYAKLSGNHISEMQYKKHLSKKEIDPDRMKAFKNKSKRPQTKERKDIRTVNAQRTAELIIQSNERNKELLTQNKSNDNATENQ